MNKSSPIKISIIFYSMYGHIHKMAEAVSEGAERVSNTDVNLYQVPELVPEDTLKESGAWQVRKEFDDIPEAKPEILEKSDAVIFGTPTRFGMMAAQMRNYLDQTGKQWAEGALEGKVGSVFACTGDQHGGQETTITSFHNTLFHHGMIVVGVPHSEKGLSYMGDISGGTPYGATTLTGPDGSRQPSENELKIAKTQGQRVAKLTNKLWFSDLETATD